MQEFICPKEAPEGLKLDVLIEVVLETLTQDPPTYIWRVKAFLAVQINNSPAS